MGTKATSKQTLLNDNYRQIRPFASRYLAFDDAREDVIYQLGHALTEAHVVPTGLFKRAQGLIGDAGIVDVTVLIGWFTMVGMTLNAFDVPANATGLDQ